MSSRAVSTILDLAGLGRDARPGAGGGGNVSLALYSRVAATEERTSQSDPDNNHKNNDDDDDDDDDVVTYSGPHKTGEEHAQAEPLQHQHPDQPSPTPRGRWAPTRPSLTRFLADFTLGFADGLTVPFALTAGLSSLGQTDTVRYAGMAEICAGSISMGIGGYLSAKGERAAAAREREARDGREPGLSESTDDPEKSATAASSSSSPPSSSAMQCPRPVAEYLAPLQLPPQLLGLVVAHVRRRPDALHSIEQKVAEDDDEQARTRSPVAVGCSVALGYLLGGLLPLFPYFVVSRVGDGLLWSFIVCVIALFGFGFTKDLLVSWQPTPKDEDWLRRKTTHRVPWKKIRHSVWEGMQMVILGSVAALSAVLCVRLFDGMDVATGNTPGP
ncbi:hypothetical protein P8C59_000476 [Phyllachora maydis]|uniref:Uncharacterized protein n=1 Tax=Phyllachora maydis TaxID=1825666 RepID=A0AAD9HXA9_9PEZI|nr:hypothetical protein P8C59_000476 [Phyllachora maydis]